MVSVMFFKFVCSGPMNEMPHSMEFCDAAAVFSVCFSEPTVHGAA